MMPKYALKKHQRDSYLELIRLLPLTSIKSDEHLVAAQEMLDQLSAKERIDEGEELYLDALSDLIATYEEVHYPIKAATDAEMLRHFLEAKGITQTQLSKATGLAKSSISEVLAGKKSFSKQMMGKLAAYFNVDVGVLAGNLGSHQKNLGD